jgi:hypothetical protein
MEKVPFNEFYYKKATDNQARCTSYSGNDLAHNAASLKHYPIGAMTKNATNRLTRAIGDKCAREEDRQDRAARPQAVDRAIGDHGDVPGIVPRSGMINWDGKREVSRCRIEELF